MAAPTPVMEQALMECEEIKKALQDK